jgi:hypothetical protein
MLEVALRYLIYAVRVVQKLVLLKRNETLLTNVQFNFFLFSVHQTRASPVSTVVYAGVAKNGDATLTRCVAVSLRVTVLNCQ